MTWVPTGCRCVTAPAGSELTCVPGVTGTTNTDTLQLPFAGLADIFRANCLKSGLVPVEMEADAAYRAPIRYRDIEVESFDALHLTGGASEPAAGSLMAMAASKMSCSSSEKSSAWSRRVLSCCIRVTSSRL